FDPNMPAWLYVPEHFDRRPPSTRWSGDEVSCHQVPSKAYPIPQDPSYLDAVAVVQEQIRGGQVDKVVLARAVDVVTDGPGNLDRLRSALERRNPGAYTFVVDLPAAGALAGASPELVVRVRNGMLVSNPLAGSSERGTTTKADAAVGHGLLASSKDRDEHRVVVDEVRRALAPLTTDIDVPDAPSLTATPQLWHLSTTIRGRPATGVTSLAAAYAVHPTPAVGGAPGPRASDLIQRLETVDRGFYAGLVGWMDAR